MEASIREWDYEESSVEYESETSVISYTSDSNDTSFEVSTTGYAHEPEYTACELKRHTPSDEICSDNSDHDDLDPSRSENLHWCRCKNQCVILHTLIECKCCREYENLLSSKLQNIDCISQREERKTLYRNNTVLENAFVLHRRRIRFFKEFDKMSKN